VGIKGRLERLEANRRRAARGYETPPYTLLYLKHLENVSREIDGLEPVPLTAEEEALEAEIDREMLRDDPTWCEEEVMAMIDQWESNVRDTPERRREEERGD
jgi:hypothetical protein